MRAIVDAYEMINPASLEAVFKMLEAEPNVWRPFAGGTDLMVQFESGRLPHYRFVNLMALKELSQIKYTPAELFIGATATYSDISSHPIVRGEFPLLAEAAYATGAPAIQNRGTLGGNIANASPAADSPPSLLVYDALLEITSVTGQKRIPYKGFHTGYKTIQLKSNEIITGIILPRGNTPTFSYFRKVGTRKAQAISKVCFAGAVTIHEKNSLHSISRARIAWGSVGPTPLLSKKVQRELESGSWKSKTEARDLILRVVACLSQDISPIDDIRSTRIYRQQVAENILTYFLSDVCQLLKA